MLYPRGSIVVEGKTKKVSDVPGSDGLGRFESKEDITAGDGEKHDVIPNKGRLSNQTTCNVFRLLKACGLPVAFVEQDSSDSFVAPLCTMFPQEVVVRRESHGSHQDRNPHLPKGHLFPRLVLEFFLKTSGKVWKGLKSGNTFQLVKDDPLMVLDSNNRKVDLYYPGHTSEERKTAAKNALVGQKPFLDLDFDEVFARDNERLIPEMGIIAQRAFLVIEKAWQILGYRYVDYKVEFGIDRVGRLHLADVIDNDSGRLIKPDGLYIDKQFYRDGGALSDVAENYRRVAELSERFKLPRQRIIFWRGSEKDNLESFYVALGNQCESITVTGSVHKEPVVATQNLQRLVQEVPDSVVIAYIGRSNGAGPTLSAMSTVPVITVPASITEFPEDIWSSLRAPSDVPVMTTLQPSNAVLAALQILSARNPRIYARLRAKIEERTINIVQI